MVKIEMHTATFRMLLRTGAFLLLFSASQPAVAQLLSTRNWYFGNSQNAIRFNRGTAKAEALTNKIIPFGTGGSAVATNPSNGNLIFYTDGNTVYDACQNVMPNGSGLNANASANQPIVICSVPGAKGQYYLFTNTADFSNGVGGAISYSVVDSAKYGNSVFPNPPLGEVTTKNTAIPALTGRSEGMIIIPNSKLKGFWLITHKSNSAVFTATLVDSTATFTHILTTLNASSPISVANFSVSPVIDKTKPTIRTIAVAPQSSNDNALILTFDNATGKFTLDSDIPNTGKTTTAAHEIYDIQWDWKGQYVYLSYFGDAGIPADVLQFDYKNPTNTLASVLPSSLKPSQSYGIQMGADSAMYYLYKSSAGKFAVGSFTKTDTIASQVKFTPLPLGDLDFLGTQFPSFLPEKELGITVKFTPISACQNASTTFYPTVTPTADSLVWNFADGSTTATSNNWSPVHTFTTAGSFNVSVTAYLQGQKKTFTQSVTVKSFALKITLVQDTTACRSEFPPKRGTATPVQFSVTAKVSGGTPASSNWSNGQVGLTLKPDSAGYYYLTVSDGLGCEVSAGVNVKEYGLSDQRSNKWYFGSKAGIDFTTNKALSDGGMTAPEGCAIVCDRNGQTIFYTDGNSVYDRTNIAIDTGIGGSPGGFSSQSSLIFQVPDDETLYYIFTTQAIGETGSNNEVRYSLFDWKKNGGKGAIVLKNVLLFSKTTERVTANGKWVIFHEYGNNFFRTYKITKDGIGEPVFSSVGIDNSQCEAGGEGYMRLSSGNILALPLKKSDGNFIQLFHLNDTTGQIVKYSKTDANNLLDLKETAGQVYGLEFTSSTHQGVKLFATVNNGASSKFVEFAIDSLSKSTLLTPKITSADLGAIQTAPNGVIYVAIKGSSSLSSIAVGSDLTKPSTLQANAFPLASGTTSLLGLPNFKQQQGNGFGGPSFTYTGVCVGDTTKFTGTGTDSIDKYAWSFGDGASSTDQSPSHLYAKAGTYNVTFRVYNRCSLDTTLSAKVTVYDPPAKPSITSAVLCNGPVTLDANKPGTSGLTYSWSTGETTKTIVVNQQLGVSVTNTDVHGCYAKASAVVADNRPQLDLGPDQTVCQNNAVNVLDASNKGATYVWTTNGVANGNTIQKQAVDTSTPGIITYGVTVTDPLTTCTVSDQITFTVNVSPSFTLAVGATPTCNTANGSVILNIAATTPTGGPYSYFLTGPGGANSQGIDVAAPSSAITFGSLGAGTISAIVIDQISGCTISKTIGLTDAAWTITASSTACDPSAITATVSPTGTVISTYTITGFSNGLTYSASNATLPIYVPQGTYTVQATDASGCIASDPAQLVVNPNPTISIEPNSSCNALTATVSSSSYTVVWTLPDLTTFAGPTVNATTSGTYTATATNSGVTPACTITSSYKLTVIAPSITQTDPCSDQVTLTAVPTGNYSYSWIKNSVPQSSLVGQQINLAVGDGGDYQVSLKDRTTGCTYTSTPVFPAKVVGTITASVTSTPPCKDGKAFTLTTTTTPTSGLTYAWALNGATLAGVNTATTDQTAEGIYQVTVASAAVPSCNVKSSITISRGPLPVGNLPSGAIICSDPENKDPLTSKVDLDPGVFVSYQWYKNTVMLSDITEKLTVTSAGTYKVDITNAYNCTASDETDVRNECIPKLVAPNAFRPGSKSADNQSFYAISFFITDVFEVVIFNRWGEIVYESKDKNFKWNGNYNNTGQQMPAGTYAYVLRYTSSFRPDKGILEQRGGVVLIR